MILGVPVSELPRLAALIIVGGVVTGILAGLFGIGGGALNVPVRAVLDLVVDIHAQDMDAQIARTAAA
jgi:uncharacterized protein